MNFGEAIKCMKKGKKVTRNVWKENFFNGKRQFVFIGRNKGLTAKTFLPIPPEDEHFSDCIMSYTRKGSFQPNWTPTQEDMLAEDWEMYPADGFVEYHNWESETKEVYEQYAHTLRENGHVADAMFVECLVEDVSEELKTVECMINDLISTGYDMVYITEIQSEIHDKYKKKMKGIEV